jgi:hypothetical protein
MNPQDKPVGSCPKCGRNKYFTGDWQDQNPVLSDGKKACVECKVEDIYAAFFSKRGQSQS